jgi:hypothetical protein
MSKTDMQLSHSIWVYLAVVGSSAPKFMVGVGLAIAGGFGFGEMFLCTALGGMLGVTGFTFFGEALRNWWQRRRTRKSTETDMETNAAPPPESATRRLGRQIWARFGLPGVAILTPPLLSPPIGVAIALAFGTPRGLLLAWMYASMLLWALLFAAVGEQILQWITQL